MNTEQPTEAQVKKVWEGCGLKKFIATDGKYHWFEDGGDICSPTDDNGNVLIDLNNLFKYAPDIIVGITFRYYPGGCECELTYITEAGFDTVKSWVQNETDDENKSRELSALALFWAIFKIDEASAG